MPPEVPSSHQPLPVSVESFYQKEILDQRGQPNLDAKASHEQDLNLSQLQQQVEISNLINLVNQAIRSTLNLEEALNSVCRLLCQFLDCSRANILVLESEGQEVLISRGEYGQEDSSTSMEIQLHIQDNTHLQALVAQPEALAISSCLEFFGLDEQAMQSSKAFQVRSMLAVATRYQQQVNGIVLLQQCDRPREWLLWEHQLLEGVGNQLAIALNQFKLSSEMQRQVERGALLRLVTNQIRSTLNLNTILETVVQEVRQLLNTDRVVFYQFTENWQGTVVVEDVQSPWRSALGEMGQDDCFSSQYAHLYQGGRVRAIDNVFEAGLDECHVNFLQQLQVRANLIVPILKNSSQFSVLRDELAQEDGNKALAMGENSPSHLPDFAHPSQLWGLLIAHECRSPRVWQTWERELLQQLGTQVAIAIQQAELYAQVKTAAAQSQAQTQQLKSALAKLQKTQMQLIQSEKLSSLGQMVAGVAHEINNAINFIHANLPHAQRYVSLFEQAISLYEVECLEPSEAIAQLDLDSELSFTRQDFPQLLQSMQTGTERIRNTVLTLRNFARLDEAELKFVDLHEGLESSLVILQHRIGVNTKIHKRYGRLPPVECYAGQINQVFLNLLTNALDAVSNDAELTIRTWQQDNLVFVAIQDNGRGIPSDIQAQIFDPFFTTKPVGQGIGLGLSICHQIVVEGHKGKIHCFSQPSEGTEFKVELPLHASVSKVAGSIVA